MGEWLMILDNADDVDISFPAVNQGSSVGPAEYIPKCPHGSVLVTTRDKQLAMKFGATIQIPKLTELESAEFIKRKLELGDTEAEEQSEEIRNLTDQLEHLPLALVQATAFIKGNSSNVKKYLMIYEGSEDRMIKLLSKKIEGSEVDSGALRAVSRTWTISFNQIRNKSHSAADLLSLMAFLDRQGIPESLLRQEKEYSESEDDEDLESGEDEDGVEQENADMESEEDEEDEVRFVQDLGILKAYSLITEFDG